MNRAQLIAQSGIDPALFPPVGKAATKDYDPQELQRLVWNAMRYESQTIQFVARRIGADFRAAKAAYQDAAKRWGDPREALRREVLAAARATSRREAAERFGVPVKTIGKWARRAAGGKGGD